jgi:hypothetical protein
MGWKPTSSGGVTVKKGGATVGTRSAINLHEGTDITLTVSDDAGNDEVDVTVTSTASGGGGGGSPDWAYDKTDNADAFDIQWDGSQSAGMTTVTVTGSQTLTEKTGVLSVKFSGQGSQDHNCLLIAHSFSIGDSFAVPLRYAGNAGFGLAGVIFTDGTTSAANAVAAHIQQHSNEGHARVYTRHGTLTAMGTVSAVFNQQSNQVPWLWLRLTYQASNTFRKEISPDGISWSTVGIADVSKTMTPTHVGLCWTVENSAGDGIATFGPLLKLA